MSADPFVVVVFCGSTPTGPLEVYHRELAQQFARMLVKAGFHCANGGNLGMMTELCRSAHEAGGVVHAICLEIPGRDMEHDSHTHHEMHDNLTTRQRRLLDRGSVFVALPGGMGTGHEILQIMAEKSFGLHAGRPMICVGEMFHHLAAYFQAMTHAGFTYSGSATDNGFRVVDTLEEVMALLIAYRDECLAAT